MKHFICLTLILAAFACAPGTPENNKINIASVPVEAGLVSGTYGSDSAVIVFKGVPFAAPPLGELRWKAPVPVVPWKGVRKCDRFAASAMQNKPAPYLMWSKEFQAPEEPLSEDCLYLNIWTAAKKTDEKRPVIVWIHGGAFINGSGSVPLYNGEEMARKGVVFITINYRLGVFGFLAHPELTGENPAKVSGNYGILDQIAALKWVKNNVTAFGGDSGRITIDGQSAGAFSVNALMVSPLAKGLFHRVIAQSGGMFGRENSTGTDLKHAEEMGLAFTESMNIESIGQLRSMPAEDLLKANAKINIIVDGYVILPAYKTFLNSAQNDVPLMTGWNADEITVGEPDKATVFKEKLKKEYGDFAPDFLKVFPANTDEQAALSQKQLAVLRFGWQNYCWASMQSKYGKKKAYLYYFSHVPPGLPNYGAFHSAEFGYALGTLKLWNRPFGQQDYQLSDIMSSYWTNFAATGDPNGNGLPVWPSFDATDRSTMDFGDEVKIIDLPLKEQLQFLDQYQQKLRDLE